MSTKYFKVINLPVEESLKTKNNIELVEDDGNWIQGGKSVKGGIAFSDSEYIPYYFDEGQFVVEVEADTCTQVFMEQTARFRSYKANGLHAISEPKDLKLNSTWKWLQTKGVNIDTAFGFGLCEIARNGGELSYFQSLLKLNINSYKKKLSTNSVELIELFNEACRGGNIQLIKFILKEFDVVKTFSSAKNLKDEKISREIGYVIWYATLSKKADIVKFVLNTFKNTSVNLNMTFALETASKNGCLDIVKTLVESGANIFDYYEKNALREACSAGHLDVVKYLVSKGDNIFDLAPYHNAESTTLSLAVSNGHLEVVKFLIEDLDANIFQSGNRALYYIDSMPMLEYMFKKTSIYAPISIWLDFLLRMTYKFRKSILLPNGEEVDSFSRQVFSFFNSNGFNLNSYNGVIIKTAIRRGNLELVKELLKLEVSIPSKDFLINMSNMKMSEDYKMRKETVDYLINMQNNF